MTEPLSYLQIHHTARIIDDLLSGNPDSAHAEDAWREIERMLEVGDATVRNDSLADTTILDVIKKVAEARARAFYQ